MADFPGWFIEFVHSIKNKRARIVAEHILQHGEISTQELTETYGYHHPPRAARDLRELGIPLVTTRTTNPEGRTIARYRFGDIAKVRGTILMGRRNFPKQFRQQLIALYDRTCAVCGATFAPANLQIDHRIPYLVAGDSVEGERKADEYQVLCNSCNRSKSWSCEHCENGNTLHDAALCATCYWAAPQSHTHIALKPIRRADVVWSETEVAVHDLLRQ